MCAARGAMMGLCPIAGTTTRQTSVRCADGGVLQAREEGCHERRKLDRGLFGQVVTGIENVPLDAVREQTHDALVAVTDERCPSDGQHGGVEEVFCGSEGPVEAGASDAQLLQQLLGGRPLVSLASEEAHRLVQCCSGIEVLGACHGVQLHLSGSICLDG